MIAPTLLVIDADPALQTLIATIVGQAGYNVHATTPHAYQHIAQQIDPAIVIVSCDRYGMATHGWEVAETLRREQPHLPLIMLSTDPDAVQEVGLTTRGRQFVAALRKPFLAEELVALVEQCVQPADAAQAR